MKVSGYFKAFGFLWICLLLTGWGISLITLTKVSSDEVNGLWMGAILTGSMFVGLLPGALLVAIGQGLEALDRIIYELKRKRL